jgi:hypothetical protein
MTRNQSSSIYFPHWSRALKAAWENPPGMTVYMPREAAASNRYVIPVNNLVSFPAHLDDLRHACTEVALRKSKSSKAFTDKELDRVVILFRLIVNPMDKDAIAAWESPVIADRKRLEHNISQYNAAYVHRLLEDRFDGMPISQLTNGQLRALVMTLSRRPNAKNPSSSAVDTPSTWSPSDPVGPVPPPGDRAQSRPGRTYHMHRFP